jgi:hypothetical protein
MICNFNPLALAAAFAAPAVDLRQSPVAAARAFREFD